MSAADTASGSKPKLITLPVSLYNDFGRWSLDSAGISYEERRQALMVHAIVTQLRGGEGTTPLLITDEQKVTNSTEIAEWADAQAGAGHHIYPQDPAGRAEAREFVLSVTEELGPATRKMAWEFLPDDVPTVVRYWSPGIPSWQAKAMPAMLKTGKPIIKRSLGLTPEELAAAPGTVTAFLDSVAERLSDGRAFLGGDRFGIHDIAFAAMASPAICPTEGYPVPHFQPDDFPDVHAERIRGFREHPAGAYAMRMYADHRSPATPGSYD
jgi:glutathione S-transferase